MLLMLTDTHDRLLQSLRDAHAAQLQLLELKLQQARWNSCGRRWNAAKPWTG
jgi:hypothetical protein